MPGGRQRYGLFPDASSILKTVAACGAHFTPSERKTNPHNDNDDNNNNNNNNNNYK